MHLAIRSAEILSVQIGMCAVGNLGYKTGLVVSMLLVLDVRNNVPG